MISNKLKRQASKYGVSLTQHVKHAGFRGSYISMRDFLVQWDAVVKMWDNAADIFYLQLDVESSYGDYNVDMNFEASLPKSEEDIINDIEKAKRRQKELDSKILARKQQLAEVSEDKERKMLRRLLTKYPNEVERKNEK